MEERCIFFSIYIYIYIFFFFLFLKIKVFDEELNFTKKKTSYIYKKEVKIDYDRNIL